MRKDDGPHPDDDDLSRLNKRVYYLFFKKKSGETVEEEEKKITRDDTAIGFWRNSPERVYAWCILFGF